MRMIDESHKSKSFIELDRSIVYRMHNYHFDPNALGDLCASAKCMGKKQFSRTLASHRLATRKPSNEHTRDRISRFAVMTEDRREFVRIQAIGALSVIAKHPRVIAVDEYARQCASTSSALGGIVL